MEESEGAAPLELPFSFSAEELDFPKLEEEMIVAELIGRDLARARF